MKIRCLLVFLITCSLGVSGQNVKSAKKLVKELSDHKYFGRGYVNKGDSIAAAYLVEEMDRIGLEKINGERLQYYTTPIVTWPYELSFVAGDNNFVCGEDFLPDPGSKSAEGKFALVRLGKKEFQRASYIKRLAEKDLSSSFLVVDTTGINSPELYDFAQNILEAKLFDSRGVLLDAGDDLRSSARTKESSRTILKMKSGTLPLDADSIELNIKNRFIEEYQTQNIIGYLPGETDTCIVFTAHYDHLGMCGPDVMFAGANDNASGVAMVLDFAKEYSKKKNHYSMLFILFSGEEAGLLGSGYYVEHPLLPLDKIKIAFNFDMVATGTHALYAFNAKEYDGVWERMEGINNDKEYLDAFHGTKAVSSSDHYSFHKKGVPAVFFYTGGGNQDYHTKEDTFDKLTFPMYKPVYKIVKEYIKRLDN